MNASRPRREVHTPHDRTGRSDTPPERVDSNKLNW
jgi:hypothetical protein